MLKKSSGIPGDFFCPGSLQSAGGGQERYLCSNEF